jgi:hypothetical protein
MIRNIIIKVNLMFFFSIKIFVTILLRDSLILINDPLTHELYFI